MHRNLAAVFVAVAALAAAGTGLALAQDKPARKAHPPAEARVEVEGEVACVACWLEKEQGAGAECEKVKGHSNGLIVEGEAWHFLDNVRGRWLRSDKALAGTRIRLSAWKYPQARVLEPRGFLRKDGEKWVDWSYCDDCATYETGKFDRLCPDCDVK